MTFFPLRLLRSLRCFLKNLHDWQKFYTTAGRTGRAKYQLWVGRVKSCWKTLLVEGDVVDGAQD